MRKGVKRALGAGCARPRASYAAWRAYGVAPPAPPSTWQPRPFPYPPEPARRPPPADAAPTTDAAMRRRAAWVDAVDGDVPGVATR